MDFKKLNEVEEISVEQIEETVVVIKADGSIKKCPVGGIGGSNGGGGIVTYYSQSYSPDNTSDYCFYKGDNKDIKVTYDIAREDFLNNAVVRLIYGSSGAYDTYATMIGFAESDEQTQKHSMLDQKIIMKIIQLI